MNKKLDRLYWFGLILTLSMIWAVVIFETRLYVLYNLIVFSVFGAVGLVLAFAALVFDEWQYRRTLRRYNKYSLMIDEELEPVGAWGSDPDLSFDIDFVAEGEFEE